MKEIITPEGARQEASHPKIFGIVLIDLLLVTVTMSLIVELLKHFGFGMPEWLTAVFGVTIFLYAFLAYRNVVKSIGGWSNGVSRYSYSEVEGYSGVGVLFVIEDLPRQILSKRAIILVLYFGVMLLLIIVLRG